ncbi:MAG: ABC transporter permease [Acidimicrobiales bacterium]|jgi:NitT/TauT family transport system permease protein
MTETTVPIDEASDAVTVASTSAPPSAARSAKSESIGLKSFASLLGPPVVVFVSFVGLWYAYSAWVGETERKISSPYPHAVLQEAFFQWDQLSELIAATWVTTKVATVGLIIAVILGILFAVLMSQAKWIERSFYPYAVLLQTMPILALVPLIGLRWGFGFNSRVIVCVIISLFPIITNTLFGLKSTERGHHDLFRLHGAGRLTRLKKLHFPGALPAMFTGFQISAGLSVIGAIVGDFFFGRGEKGLGIKIRDYTSFLETEMLIGGIIFSALLGITMFQLFGVLGRLLTGSWHESGGDGT